MKSQIASRIMSDRSSFAGTTVKGVVAAVLILWATVSLAATQIPDCVPGKLSDYEKLGPEGCAIGDKIFASFRYLQGVDGLPSDAISVTPGTVPDSDDAALLFEAAWITPSRHRASVSYTVIVQPSGKPITGASLEMQFGQITGTGEARVVAELCPLDRLADGCATEALKLNVILTSGQLNQALDKGQFKSPLQEVRVITPLSLTPGKAGSASLNGFMTVFHATTTQPLLAGSPPASSAPGGTGQ